ncbi:FG-GAP repeat domain-containing protein [Caulobacter sp. Root487D2Y]|uniref:FG-GAP repeat domain-containing protein n=1 Tax=Caulobacter sp. Root487D2Y TaxID=1736547 RepID=UPI000AA8BCCE|nr:VCBS repeat-containing protein [Caulobacter sp. Root487D2Y]
MALATAAAATAVQAQAKIDYTYDAQGQLSSVSRVNEIESYTYDAAANRTGVVVVTRPFAIWASPYFGSSAASGNWAGQNVNPRFMADVNGDGDDDLIGIGGSSVYVAFGQTNGVFSYPVTATASMTPAASWANNTTYPRTAAKVNADSYADLVGFAGDGVYVGLGQANGAFATPYKATSGFGVNSGWASQETVPRFLADLNHDGRADIIGIANDSVWVALGNATGGFNAQILASTQFTASQGWTSQNLTPRALADVNGDTYGDLVGFASDGVYVALGLGNGTFAAAFKAIAGFGQATGGWTDFDTYPRYVRDVTGDGLADVVGFGSNYVYVSAGQSNGAFAAWQSYPTRFVPGMGWGPQSIQPRLVGDVDGDLKADLIGIAPDGAYMQQIVSGAALRSMAGKSTGENAFPMAAAQSSAASPVEASLQSTLEATGLTATIPLPASESPSLPTPSSPARPSSPPSQRTPPSPAGPGLATPTAGTPPLGAQRFGPKGEALPTPYPIEPPR